MKQSLPIKITGPIRMHFVLLLVGIAGCCLAILNFFDGSITETKDYAMIGIFVIMTGWFGYRVFNPKLKIVFSEKGIWTTIHGQKSWSDFAGVAIEKQKRRKYDRDVLLLLFDIEEEPKELQYDFYDLNISVKVFKELMNGPLKGYMEL
ncbi:MAG: hypothetical protein AAFQ94_19580 [Bacteroidota bacterium]